MLETDRLPPAVSGQFWRPERKAWAIILSAFAIFCILTSATAYAGYRMVMGPKSPSVTAQVDPPSTALLQRAGTARSEVLVDKTPLAQGDRVIIPEGPPGIAARLHRGGATIALWPASSVLAERSTSGQLRLRIESGQALVELPLPGPSVFLAASKLANEVELTAPGRYRVRWLSDKGMVTALAERSLAQGFEIATGEGLAQIGEIAVKSGERLVTSGTVDRHTNRWSLLRDGDFRDYSAEEYLATLRPEKDAPKSDTWLVTRHALSEGANVRSGLFYVREECIKSVARDQECRNTVRFARLGGNDKDAITGITQEIAADVSAYRSVVFEADIRVDFQSLSKGGADGTECPLFARVDYANSVSSEAQKYYCFWAFDDGRTGAISALPYISSRQIPPKTWYHFRVDLHQDIPDLRAIHRVVFYSNGHDYDASVTDVALRAEGLTVAARP
jgi:hypothetical protein